MSLSILIPSTPDRDSLLSQLLIELYDQIGETGRTVEVLVELDNFEKSVGEKRNILLERAKGDYVAFIDSDDGISKDYIARVFEGIDKGVDACSLKGIFTENGKNPEVFEHSIAYDAYKTNDFANNNEQEVKYERYPNHLNTIRSSIAKQFKFPLQNVSEDSAWAKQLYNSKLIQTEHYIESIIYFYRHNSNDSVQTRK